MRHVIAYLQALWQGVVNRVVFTAGVVSTLVTFLPALGLSVPKPEVLRVIGAVLILFSFLSANCQVFVQQSSRLEKLKTENMQLSPERRERDIDAVRHVVMEKWRERMPGEFLHVSADAVRERLGWERDRFDAIALRAAGKFGGLEIHFDGRNFHLERVPI